MAYREGVAYARAEAGVVRKRPERLATGSGRRGGMAGEKEVSAPGRYSIPRGMAAARVFCGSRGGEVKQR